MIYCNAAAFWVCCATIMAPGKPVGVIKVQVPRHNAQRMGAKLTAEVEAQADSAGVRTDVGQSSHEMTQAIVRQFLASFSQLS